MSKIKFLSTSMVLLVFVSFFAAAQECNCTQNFEWVKNTFEHNDAGFAYIIEQKGEQAYADHNARILAKVQSAESFNDCAPILYEWLTFFRSGHISIWPTDAHSQQQESAVNSDPSQWESIDVDVESFNAHLLSLSEPGFEGIWEMPSYTVGVKRFGEEYVGFILESPHDNWNAGHVKFRFNISNNKSEATFYLLDRTPIKMNNVRLVGYNHLLLGNDLRLSRSVPINEKEQDFTAYFRLLEARQPYLERLDATTLYMRIPSFMPDQKAMIDALLKDNLEEILSTKNLILDIRNGTGGSDVSYYEILPILYTNPIREVGVEFLSTPLNNQRMLALISNPDYGLTEEQKQWAKESYEKLEKHHGLFLNLSDEVTSVTRFDTVFQYPQNIGIIINESNGSTDEQFLLAAKQSRKVKLFGRTTHGMLDISNMNFVESPCKEFNLGYGLTRSLRIPGFAIDEKGIQPDFYLDKSIPEYEWVDFVRDVLRE